MKLAGIVLIIIGVLALVYQGFTYTKTEKDLQLGPLEVQHRETHTIPLPPYGFLVLSQEEAFEGTESNDKKQGD